MNKLSYFMIIALFLSMFGTLNAQDPCPFDQHLYEDEQKLMPELSEFLAGKRYLMPEGTKLKGYGEFKYNPELLLKILRGEDYNVDDYTQDLTPDEKAFFAWVIEYTKNRAETNNYQLVPPAIAFDLGMDWRMRGQKSQRPNDPEQVEFSVRKAKAFKDEMSKTLKIDRDSKILDPETFTNNMFELVKGIEYSEFSKFKEYKAELYCAFGEILTITGLKHNAFRAYRMSTELTENKMLHQLAEIAAREIKQSQRADFDKFEDEFLNKQKEEAQKFNTAFTEYAKEHTEITYFATMKKDFVEGYGKSNSNSILLLAIFGVLMIVMLIFFSKKSVSGCG